MTFLVEIEYSTLNTYRIEAADEASARALALKRYPLMNSIEEHEEVSVHSCVEVPED